jgi:hypothetical protein
MLKIGPIMIGHDDRPWIVRQMTSRRRRIHLHGFVPDYHRGGDLPHLHVTRHVPSLDAATRWPRLERLTERVGWTIQARTRRPSRWQRWTRALGPIAAAVACGMLIAYVFDPAAGRRRRAIVRDRATGALHRTGRRMSRLGRATGARANGLYRRATHARFEMPTPVDDVVLLDRVRAVLFREHDFPKGRISIDAANGVVALRGEVERHDQIDQIEAIVWGVPGVADVENLLHMPGTPAPNTITALEAGR